MIDVVFEAALVPEGLARARAAVIAGRPRMYTPKRSTDWQSQLAAMATQAMPAEQIDEPLRVDVFAVFPRTKDLMRPSRPDGFIPHVGRPDLDNVVKNVLDALKPFWRDDSIVCVGTSAKAYAERTGHARVMVRVRSAKSLDRIAEGFRVGA